MKPVKQPTPPKLALRLLSWFCPQHLYEEIEGDLIQRFKKDATALGEPRARRRLIWNTIRFFRPGILLRNKLSVHTTQTAMISNYLKIAVRIMSRNKSYTFISLFSLSLGITAFAFLFLFIQHEFSFDQFHSDKDRIYKAWNRDTNQGGVASWDVTPRVLAPTLLEEY